MNKKHKKTVMLTVIIAVGSLGLLSTIGWIIYRYGFSHCTPGYRECKDNEVQQCSEDSREFSSIDTCDTCVLGKCSDDDITNYCGDNICQPYENCREDCGELNSSIITFTEYEVLRTLHQIPNKYLEETEWYDYSAVNIQELKTQLKKDTPENTVKAVIKYVSNNVEYNDNWLSPQGLYEDCLNTPASEIISRQKGICSTMSKVDISLLRSMGIASRMVSGCYELKGGCIEYLTIPQQKEFKYLKADEVWVTTGYLHAWVEVWLPDRGWVLVESTAGRLFPDSCLNYDKYFTEEKNNLCGFIPSVAEQCKSW